MSNKVNFEGMIIRVEIDGFGVVKFDKPIGANTYGIFSSSVSEPTVPFGKFKPGMHVTGVAEIDDRDLAAVRTLTLPSDA